MGPDFLTKPEAEWPDMPDSIRQPLGNDPEVKAPSVCALSAEESMNSTSQLIHPYSSWCHLKRGVAWILKLKCILKLLAQRRKDLETSLKARKLDEENQKMELEKEMGDFKASLIILPLSVSDVAEAELEVVRFSQGDRFSKEVAMLQQGKLV